MGPKRGRERRLCEEGDNTLRQCAIGAFSNTVLMGLIAQSVLNGDTTLLQMGLECVRDVFASLVVPECLDLASSLCFSISLEALKCLKHIRLVA